MEVFEPSELSDLSLRPTNLSKSGSPSCVTMVSDRDWYLIDWVGSRLPYWSTLRRRGRSDWTRKLLIVVLGLVIVTLTFPWNSKRSSLTLEGGLSKRDYWWTSGFPAIDTVRDVPHRTFSLNRLDTSELFQGFPKEELRQSTGRLNDRFCPVKALIFPHGVYRGSPNS